MNSTGSWLFVIVLFLVALVAFDDDWRARFDCMIGASYSACNAVDMEYSTDD